MDRPPADHHDVLMTILQKAEMKAKMSLYYLQQDLKQSDKKIDPTAHDTTKIDQRIAHLEKQIGLLERENKEVTEKEDESSEMLRSSQMYCKGLETKIKASEKQEKSQRALVAEKIRHCEAMEEEIEELNRKIIKYPKKMESLRGELEKLRNKIILLEEQKKIMESQATQNEQQVQDSHTIRQDLQHANRYIDRLKCYLNKTNEAKAPLMQADYCAQTGESYLTRGDSALTNGTDYKRDYNAPSTEQPPTKVHSYNAPSAEQPPTKVHSSSTEQPPTKVHSYNAPSAEQPPTKVHSSSTEQPPTKVHSYNAPSAEQPPTKVHSSSTEQPPTKVHSSSTEQPPTKVHSYNAPSAEQPPTKVGKVHSSGSTSTNEACAQYKASIDQARLDLSLLRQEAAQLTTFCSDLETIKGIVGKMSGTSGEGCYDHLPFSHLPTEFLLETERVEVITRILSPAAEEHTAVWSTGESSRTVLLRNNTVQQYTCDAVIPMNAPYKQLMRNAVVSTSVAIQGRSTLIMMFGNASSTLYGSPEQPGLISRIISELLKAKRDDMKLSASIATFHSNQMCDALLGVEGERSGDKKMTTLRLTSHEQAAALLSQANISDDSEYVLNQFSLQHSTLSVSSVSVLECADYDSDTTAALHQYRVHGKVPNFTKADVVSDTLQAYITKGASITVYLNISPETVHLSESEKYLDMAAKVTGVAPVTTNKRKSLFKFR